MLSDICFFLSWFFYEKVLQIFRWCVVVDFFFFIWEDGKSAAVNEELAVCQDISNCGQLVCALVEKNWRLVTCR